MSTVLAERIKRISQSQVQEDLSHLDQHYAKMLQDFHQAPEKVGDVSIRDLTDDYGISLEKFQEDVEQHPIRVRQSKMAKQKAKFEADHSKFMAALFEAQEHEKAEIKRLSNETHRIRSLMNGAASDVREAEEAKVLLLRTCPYKGLLFRKADVDQRLDKLRYATIDSHSRLRDCKESVSTALVELDRLSSPGMSTHSETLKSFASNIDKFKLQVIEAQQLHDALTEQAAALNRELDEVFELMQLP